MSATPSRPSDLPGAFSWTVAVAVGFLIFLTATIITFILPETYASVARLKLDQLPPLLPEKSQLTDAQAAAVVDKLDLKTEWGRFYGAGESLTTEVCLRVLAVSLRVQTVKNASILAVTAYSPRPQEAANIANAAAAELARGQGSLIDQAVPGLRPVRPNKPLNLTLGIALGILVGAAAGAVAAFAQRFLRQRLGVVVARPS